MLGKKLKANNILIVKSMDDPRLRYITAKKLAEMWPETPFMDWKRKLDALETIVLTRSESMLELGKFKRELETIEAAVEIVQQKSIGGKPVF
ncbi:MAG: hypothetical protein L3J79_02800 [Candidatus Marinimicrobia bacterium]|nr:hypothetical protein [Candidatus Neomarinimicrobiota bacterium]